MLRSVATATIRPCGPRFDPKPILRYPQRALRGGDDGIVVGFAVRGGAIEVTVMATGVASDEDIERAMIAARGLVGADDDASEFLAMVRDHDLLGTIAKQVDVRLTRTPSVFESFAEAVIAQLVTSEEARDAKRRLWAHAGLLVRGTSLRAAPTAAAVSAVPSWKMHMMGVGSRRFLTLHEGARRGVAIERIAHENANTPEVFMEKLMSLRGVGPWTANRVARAALGHADAVPVGDFHAPRFVTEALTGECDGTDETMLAALDRFRPHRARAVLLLERAQFARNLPVTWTPSRRPRVDPHRREPWRY